MIIRKSANQNFKKIHNRRKTALGRTKQGDHRLEVRREEGAGVMDRKRTKGMCI